MSIVHMPLFILRLRPEAYFDSGRMERAARCIRENPGCFDDVWVNSLSVYAPRDQHRKSIERASAAADVLRKTGVTVSLQISETIGHGGGVYRPAGFEQGPEDWMVGADGQTAESICCPTGERFLAYTAEICGQYAAALLPFTCYIDDDLRMQNHGRLRYGCFCPRCLELFSARTGSPWTRKVLAAGLTATGREVPLRLEWMKFNQERMAVLAGRIAREIHRKSPKTVMGIQTCVFTEQYNGVDFTPVYRALSMESGHPARVRIGAGAYRDHDPDQLVLKALSLGNSAANAVESGFVDHICSEIENYPVTALSKSSYGTALEALLGIAFGCRSVSAQLGQLFLMPDNVPEKFFRRLAAWRGVCEKVSALHDDCRFDGFNLYHSLSDAARPVSAEGQDPWNWSCASILEEVRHLMNSGVPVNWNDYGKTPTPYVVTLSGARGMDEAELHRVVRAGALFSGDAFCELERRGLTGFAGVVSKREPAIRMERGVFCDFAMSGGRVGEYHPVPLFGANPLAFEIRPDSVAVPLLRYHNSLDGAEYAVGAWRWENPEYGRMAVIGTPGAFTGEYNPGMLELLRNLLDFLGACPAGVRAEDCARIVLIPAVERHSGRTRGVTVLNVGIEPLETIRLRVRRPASRAWMWRVPEHEPSGLIPEKGTEEEISLLLPGLPAWGAGVLIAE